MRPKSNVELEPHQNVFILKWPPYRKKMVAMITCHVNFNLWFDWPIVCFGPSYQMITVPDCFMYRSNRSFNIPLGTPPPGIWIQTHPSRSPSQKAVQMPHLGQFRVIKWPHHQEFNKWPYHSLKRRFLMLLNPSQQSGVNIQHSVYSVLNR